MTEFSHTNPRRAERKTVPSLFWSTAQAAKHYHVSELTVRRHVKSGRLPAVQIGGTWRLPADNAHRVYDLPLECSIHDVANSLYVSEVTVRRWIRDANIPAKKSGRSWLIRRQVIESLLATALLATSEEAG